MAARPLSSATISFGLVSIPCQLYSSAETTKKVSFNFLSPDGKRVKQQYVDSATEAPVNRADLIKGYQFAKDKFVTFSPDELKALEAQATQTIAIEEFVPLDKVERAYIGKTYYMGPDKGGAKAYALLGAAMRKTERAALGRYAARGKQYLVLVRTVGQHLVMEQLHYQHEVRDIAEVPAGDDEVSDAELGLAVQFIDQLGAEEFDPSKYRDEVGDRMLEAIEKKISEGSKIEAALPEQDTGAAVIDIMRALKASVQGSADSESGQGVPEAGRKSA